MRIFASLLCMILFWSCQNKTIFVKNGDLLLVGNSKSDLSKAIDEVTKTSSNHNFSHIAILEVDPAHNYWVLHSSTENGSERISLESFIQKANKDTSEVILYRVKEKNVDFDQVIKNAKAMLDKPYNFSYILSDTAYYCSDFVHNAFVKDSIFEMEPMTFKDPKSGKFHPTWIEFYKKLNVAIPEGQPGCNPNGMAASPKLQMIGRLN